MIDITSLLHKSLTIIIICYLIKKMIKELILLTIFYIPYKNNIKTPKDGGVAVAAAQHRRAK